MNPADEKPSLPLTPRPTTLLVDLDGTLVDIRGRDLALELRFLVRAVWRFRHAIPPWKFRRVFWKAIRAMRQNTGSELNYRVFLSTLAAASRFSEERIEAMLTDCVEEDFRSLANHFVPVAGAAETIALARKLGYRLVLATNPVFPLEAVRMRLTWGGFDASVFEYITHSQVMTRCKPKVAYYQQLLDQLSLDPAECVMIGNEWEKDAAAALLGVRTWLLGPTSHQRGANNNPIARGSHQELRAWLERSAEAGK